MFHDHTCGLLEGADALECSVGISDVVEGKRFSPA